MSSSLVQIINDEYSNYVIEIHPHAVISSNNVAIKYKLWRLYSHIIISVIPVDIKLVNSESNLPLLLLSFMFLRRRIHH